MGCDSWDRYDFRALLQLFKNFCFINLEHDEEYYCDIGSDCSSSYPLTEDPTSSACIQCAVIGVWVKPNLDVVAPSPGGATCNNT